MLITTRNKEGGDPLPSHLPRCLSAKSHRIGINYAIRRRESVKMFACTELYHGIEVIMDNIWWDINRIMKKKISKYQETISFNDFVMQKEGLFV